MKHVLYGLLAVALVASGAYTQATQVAAGNGVAPHNGARTADNDDDGLLPLFAPFDDATGIVVVAVSGVDVLIVEIGPGMAAVVVGGSVIGYTPTTGSIQLVEAGTPPVAAGRRSCWRHNVAGGYFFLWTSVLGGDGCQTIECAIADYHAKRAGLIQGGSLPVPSGHCQGQF